ncbi:MAG: amidophosphoribosyltransferase [Gammaproteobacteria bacterium]
MCGIAGYSGNGAAAAAVYSALAFLQHRGQDSAGIAAMSGSRLFIEKGRGLARDVFDAAKMSALRGTAGIGHVRYSTSGSAMALSEIQPFYVNQPFGISLVHNGNLVNREHLHRHLASGDRRHVNSDSDSELLLNVLAQAVHRRGGGGAEAFLDAVGDVHECCAGAYSAAALIAGAGLLAFRDPRGIRPLSLGAGENGEWLVASESAAFEPLNFKNMGDIAPGEAVFIDMNRKLHRKQFPGAAPRPCIFEYIYFARPDSLMEGALVYNARVNMGRRLAAKILREHAGTEIDCVVPIPDSGRVAALEVSRELGAPYREGLVKNRHTGRTFITAGQARRRRSVAEKLNIIAPEFSGKRVLMVDDSIVRGTTGAEIVGMARLAGARRVYFASAAPPVRHPNVFGIDIATRGELVASGRGEAEITTHLGADRVIYQDMEDLQAAVRDAGGNVAAFETSCFDGDYPDGIVDEEYLRALEEERGGGRDDDLSQMDLALRTKP